MQPRGQPRAEGLQCVVLRGARPLQAQFLVSSEEPGELQRQFVHGNGEAIFAGGPNRGTQQPGLLDAQGLGVEFGILRVDKGDPLAHGCVTRVEGGWGPLRREVACSTDGNRPPKDGPKEESGKGPSTGTNGDMKLTEERCASV